MDNLKLLWYRIKQRCYCKNNPNYKRYGARGIIISKEFHDFKIFSEYVRGLVNYDKWLSHYNNKPHYRNPISIDRVNNNSNYERGNLRWSTFDEQVINRRSYKGLNTIIDIPKLNLHDMGVFIHKPSLKKGYKKIYRARVSNKGRRVHLGYHETPELALLAIEQYWVRKKTIYR